MVETEKTSRVRDTLRCCGPLALLWTGCIVYLETLLHMVVFGGFSPRFLYALGFSVCAGCLFGWATGLLGRRGNRRICTALMGALCFLYASQLAYHYVFGTMYSLSMVPLGVDAIKNFWRELLISIGGHLPVLALCFAPVLAAVLLGKRAGWIFDGGGKRRRLWLPAAAALLHGLLLLCLYAGGTGPFTAYDIYHGSSTKTDHSAGSFGLLTTFRLELGHIFAPGEETPYYTVVPEPAVKTPPSPGGGAAAEDEPEPIEYGYNVLDIDFGALSAMTEDDRLKRISDYCAQLTGTKKNEYTGRLRDYNLIVLCGEAFSSAAIDKELTPTLWRLAHEGFVFKNYFNTFPNSTTDGEYSLCQGLLPDSSRGKTAPSFYASRGSYLPMCLGNIFREQRGIGAFGYHNYYSEFYGRYLTHPNMGYSMKFADQGMRFTTDWPSSDLEMMEQSIPDYIGGGQFHAYYMTFSGHLAYNRAANPMAARNYDAVKDLPYSEAAKCYLACNIELDKAMAYLLEQLEAAGVADRTAIVMAGDHFPYGLTQAEYAELIGHETDFYDLYRNTLIFWVGGLDQPVEVDRYCCNVDILPTILNLWGFDYDSRLLAGTDVFSDGPHVAMLADRSFLTDTVWFNAGSYETTWLADESEAPDGYLDGMIALVQNRFSFSTDILNAAYYNFVFGKEPVSVSREGWISEEEWNGTAAEEDEDEESEDDAEVEAGQQPE